MSPRTVEAPPLRRLIVPAIFVGALFLVTFLRQPDGPDGPEQWLLTGPTMGTVFTVKIVTGERPDPDRSDLEAAVRGTIDGVELAMSTYRDDSELSRFNRHGTEPFPASPELLEVVVEAQRVSRLSDGAFDITVGPLVDAWGFGPEPVAGPPSDAEIAQLVASHGYQLLEVDLAAGTLRKTRPGVRCDLSAIAKGYAVDRVTDALRTAGLTDFMVEIGGEVRTVGSNAAGKPWRIGVERPVVERGGVWTAVPLIDAALATSGDYRNTYELAGIRISHTIDPRTGRPVTHALASVSVVHSSCATADALATALEVLGPAEGRALVEREGLTALFIMRAGDDRFDEWASPAWRRIAENTGGDAGVVQSASDR